MITFVHRLFVVVSCIHFAWSNQFLLRLRVLSSCTIAMVYTEHFNKKMQFLFTLFYSNWSFIVRALLRDCRVPHTVHDAINVNFASIHEFVLFVSHLLWHSWNWQFPLSNEWFNWETHLQKKARKNNIVTSLKAITNA